MCYAWGTFGNVKKNVFMYLQKELPNKKDCPHMCAYKLVTVKFKWWGLQNKVENFIQKVCWEVFCFFCFLPYYHFDTTRKLQVMACYWGGFIDKKSHLHCLSCGTYPFFPSLTISVNGCCTTVCYPLHTYSKSWPLEVVMEKGTTHYHVLMHAHSSR